MKWVLTRKWQGTVLARFKARLVLSGWGLDRGVDYIESWIGTAPPSDLRMLTAIALEPDLLTFEIDLIQAYIAAMMPPQPNGKPVLARMPAGSKRFNANGAELGLLLTRAVYGHPVSGWAFQQDLYSALLSNNKHEHLALSSSDSACRNQQSSTPSSKSTPNGTVNVSSCGRIRTTSE